VTADLSTVAVYGWFDGSAERLTQVSLYGWYDPGIILVGDPLDFIRFVMQLNQTADFQFER
jgi:hypothetical protein